MDVRDVPYDDLIHCHNRHISVRDAFKPLLLPLYTNTFGVALVNRGRRVLEHVLEAPQLGLRLVPASSIALVKRAEACVHTDWQTWAR